MKICDFRQRKVCHWSFYYGMFLGAGIILGLFTYHYFIAALLCALSYIYFRQIELKINKNHE